MKTEQYIYGIGFFGLLAIAFIILKLCKIIAWSWIWVLAPIWIPMTLGFIFVLIFIALLAWAKTK